MAGKKTSGKRTGDRSRIKRNPSDGSGRSLDGRVREIVLRLVREAVFRKLNEKGGISGKKSGSESGR